MMFSWSIWQLHFFDTPGTHNHGGITRLQAERIYLPKEEGNRKRDHVLHEEAGEMS